MKNGLLKHKKRKNSQELARAGSYLLKVRPNYLELLRDALETGK